MRILACILILGASGCVIPLPSKPDPTAKFSKEELAFLGTPDATRAETLSTLGSPLLDVSDPGVMVYTRAEVSRFYVIPPEETGMEPGVSEGARHAWVLLIAYDQRGHILAHKVRKLHTET